MSNLTSIDVIILCGGLGTRLRSVESVKPKVMVEVEGRPFLDIIVGHLKKEGFRRLILCTGYKAEMIEEHYRRDPHGLTIEFSRESEPLGTGGAIKNAQGMVLSSSFFVLNGDSYCPLPYGKMFEHHQRQQLLATIAVGRTKEKEDFGGIRMEDGRVTAFVEKDANLPGEFVNAGVYCFEKKVLSVMPSGKFSMEVNFFPKIVKDGISGFLIDQKFLDIGTPERYLAAKKELKAQ